MCEDDRAVDDTNKSLKNYSVDAVLVERQNYGHAIDAVLQLFSDCKSEVQIIIVLKWLIGKIILHHIVQEITVYCCFSCISVAQQ